MQCPSIKSSPFDMVILFLQRGYNYAFIVKKCPKKRE
jgi:hypothetical protein